MFPSIITAFPIVNTTDRLNSPSHSALENLQSSTIGQIQAVVGLSTSSALGTLMYDVRSPDSNGGGHIQTAIKGGTGQTTYTKGDLLVATSTSVLSKLSTGLDGQALIADSSVAAGVKWGTAAGNKIAAVVSVMGMTTSSVATGGASIISAIIPGSTLGATGGVRLTAYVSDMQMSGAGASVMLRAVYGNTNIASVLLRVGASSDPMVGTIQYNLANSAVNAQRGILTVNLGKIQTSIATATNAQINTMDTGGATEDSSGSKRFGITGVNANNSVAADGVVTIQGYVVEKIV